MPTTEATTTLAPPAQRRPGAQPGDRRAFRHGLRGVGLPPQCRKIEQAINHFRRMVEDSVLQARGEITLIDSAFVNTAYRAERHAQLAQRWLALEADLMTPGDRLNYSREVVRASVERDKALQALNLPKRDDGSVWATLKPTGSNGNG